MAKDSQETRDRLVAAVGQLLAREGFQRIGVNAVAREAGVDKVLIYRYFDGITDLVAAFCRTEGFWPTGREIMGADPDTFSRLPFARQVADSSINFLRALRRRPVAREVLAWRFLVHNELTEALDQVRQDSWLEVLRHVQAPEQGAPGDVLAFQAVLGAAVNHLGARSDKLVSFAGIDLTDESGWERIEAMIRSLCEAQFGVSVSKPEPTPTPAPEPTPTPGPETGPETEPASAPEPTPEPAPTPKPKP